MCRLQLAEGFPEPTASVVELLNNFTGLSETKELLIRISVEIRQFTVDKEFDVS